MIIELYILLFVVMLISFFVAFFTHQELLWAITLVLSGVLMITSFNIEFANYLFDSTTGGYSFVFTTQSYPFMMGINMLFFVLAMILGLFDLFDKYGISVANFKGKLK
jgi:hypothetical protein